TEYDTLIFTGSGTATMEGAIVGCNPPGSKALVIEGGKFSQRWGLICERFEIDCIRHEIEWGTAIDPQVIADYLEKDPAISSVILVHSETSTATVCDLEAIGKITHAAGKLLLADCITSAGALPLRPDDWHVDVVVSGSQKAFMLPPGLGVAAVGPRAWETIEKNTSRKAYYLDYSAARKSALKHDTPYTPALTLIRGLRMSTAMLLEEGLENVWKRVAAQAAATRAAAEAIGMKVFSQRPSDSVTAISVPESINEGELRKALRDTYGMHLAGGQDHLKGKIVRMSHMGYIDVIDTLGVIGAIEQIAHRLGHPFELGAGLTAAQKVFAEQL
ncbi:MAG: alanine--glyoxylate aminotransferase family protein, partial [Planctomycetes bacterium]|nr:alanine--glyoxylate aminotransferase family protein [Planctomycetota bacterium]